jgi:hypothetical protein
MRMKPKLFSRPTIGHPFTKGLVGCWLMNEGGGNIVADLSGDGNNGTLINSAHNAHYTSGKFGPAIDFYGNGTNVTGDIISIPYSNSLSFDYVTISTWIYLHALPPSNPYRIFVQGNWTVTGSMLLFITSAGQIDCRFIIATQSSSTANSAIAAKSWNHIVATYDGINIKVYINSKLDKTIDKSGTINHYTGDYFINGVPWYYGNIMMSDFFMWNRALTASEITYLYCNPFCMFEEDGI